MRKGSPRVLFIQYFVALHVEGQPLGSAALHVEGQPLGSSVQYFVALHVEGQPLGSIYSVLCGLTCGRAAPGFYLFSTLWPYMWKGSPRVLFIQYFVALHVEGQPPGSIYSVLCGLTCGRAAPGFYLFNTLWPYMWKGSPRVLFIQYFVALHVEGQPPGSIYSVLCGFT